MRPGGAPDGAAGRPGRWIGVWSGLWVGVVLAGLGLAACDRTAPSAPTAAEAIRFSILSAQAQASVEPLWAPLLEDMARAVGAEVTPRFGDGYAALVEDLKAGRVQAGWYSAQPAVEALQSGKAELVARTVGLDGQDSYRSVIVARKGAGVTLDQVTSCGRRLSLGLGDPESTSASLAPVTFLFAPRGIRPETCFRSVARADHEDNLFKVATGALDLAATNDVGLKALAEQNPALAAQIEPVWTSSAIPQGAILMRTDLDPVVKEKVRSFFLTYGEGRGGAGDRQRQVLKGLGWSRFAAADDAYLDPVREMIAVRDEAQARDRGDAAAAARAARERRRLQAEREVRP